MKDIEPTNLASNSLKRVKTSMRSSFARIKNKGNSLRLNMKCLKLPEAPPNVRLCFDFGTAMSKITLVQDRDEDDELDTIHVLDIGKYGNQEEISENMLISSVYIDDNGLLWFGQNAVLKSQEMNKNTPHQRLDSIKKFLLEDKLDNINEGIPSEYNPTERKVTYRDIVLAYLMFLTWTSSKALKGNYPQNIKRRFAIPGFEDKDGNVSPKVDKLLRQLLAEAQVLADTFHIILDTNNGISLKLYLKKITELKRKSRAYSFISESLTEPVGVANSYLNPTPATEISTANPIRHMILVIDIGAGTSDMGLFMYWLDSKENKNKASPVINSSRTLVQAGDYIDDLLMEFILAQAGIDREHQRYQDIRNALLLKIRGYKEILFENKFVKISELNYEFNIDIKLEDFMKTKKINDFSNILKEEIINILENIDSEFIRIMQFTGTMGYLNIMLTGGGANLPMLDQLISDTLDIKNSQVPIKRMPKYPIWMEKEYQNLEKDYPRIAVSLGGARKDLIQLKDSIATPGAVGARPVVPDQTWP